MNYFATVRKFAAAAAVAAVSMLATSCGLVTEDGDVCPDAAATLTFRYDMNLKWADAFTSEVKSVHVLMFDESGVLRYQWRKQQSELVDGNTLPINVEPGEYDILVWAGDYHKSACVADPVIGKSTIQDFHLKVDRLEGAKIKDSLEPFYHATKHVSLSLAKNGKSQNHVLYLTKDTNEVRVVLQQLSGDPVKVQDLDVQITDGLNGWLDHNNMPMADDVLTYHPHYTRCGTVEVNNSTVGAMTTEFTVSRLMDFHKPMLTVYNKKDGRKVFAVNLVDYALLVKGHYRDDLTDQGYLDRQDEYNMTFFLDEDLQYISTEVIINGWHIVLNDVDAE